MATAATKNVKAIAELTPSSTEEDAKNTYDSWASSYEMVSWYQPLHHLKGDLIDFTLSNARWFYLSKGDPLVVKGLICFELNC